ncbi:tumor necrosis factor ligand superfamily member 4 isoform X1 [Fukomys damarensis]|uniref:Tumor necrosis factor ligand superfamily member 4 n=1 Tax=Fukomys damarensis TaxID=885580 RepID=A0A091DDA7_FUKDA|nr:tumor necrosis factor ligand superfamily member 4 isoform X1 [Fukomys damarensis]KFO28493.1 Tumor necrosis factor ligand superfamily member 4 [Fukomys damarensis]
MKMEGVPPLEGNVGSVPRPRPQWNKVLLVVSVIQGLGLVLCLAYICLHVSAPEVQHPPVQSISLLLTGCEEEKLTLIPNNAQIMTVENNSVIITCDGFYLISVKGYFQEEVSISLHYRMHQNPISIPLRKDLQADFTTVVSLAYKDKVYLSINSPNTSCEDFRMNGGELYLIQQNPGGFCI